MAQRAGFRYFRLSEPLEFREWFRRSSELFAKHQGFISRTLLKSTEGTERYAAVVEHESKETFMAMHLSDDRQSLFKKVETLIDGMPEPHFYEVAASYRKEEVSS